ncbi:hypothetical protein VZ52_17695 [Ralstonia mannitolilytica]|nr:hypothetical protein VZ52_17695 [Ralstonia mannitolilytica]
MKLCCFRCNRFFDSKLQWILSLYVLIGTLAVTLKESVQRKRCTKALPYLGCISFIIYTFSEKNHIRRCHVKLTRTGANRRTQFALCSFIYCVHVNAYLLCTTLQVIKLKR